MPNADRAAVAREVLTEFAEWARNGPDAYKYASRAPSSIEKYRDEYYPAPPAPETVTVTVDEVEWYLMPRDGGWGAADDDTPPNAADAQDFLYRIASDARVIKERDARIAELEKAVQDQPRTLYDSMWQAIDRMGDAVGALTGPGSNCHVTAQRVCETLEALKDERDAALRALRERDEKCSIGNETPTHFIPVSAAAVIGATSCNVAGCRCGEAGGPAATMTRVGASASDSGAASPDESPAASPSPAPIPLGAVMEVANDSGAPYTRCESGWKDSGSITWNDDGGVAPIITALYHASHPVATRETVERVAAAINSATGALAWPESMDCARAALTAAGITLEEGA